jgi:uncharacterized coiled-coil DUF342 family protein
MLTNEDIKKLIEVFATRQGVATKQDLKELKKDFSNLQTAVDRYAYKADAYFQEMVVLTQKLTGMKDGFGKLLIRLT